MTLQDWHKDETKALRLKELIANPILNEAITLAIYHQLPRNLPKPDGVDPLTALALLQSHSTGWHDAIRFIKDTLTSRPHEKPTRLPIRSINPEA